MIRLEYDVNLYVELVIISISKYIGWVANAKLYEATIVLKAAMPIGKISSLSSFNFYGSSISTIISFTVY